MLLAKVADQKAVLLQAAETGITVVAETEETITAVVVIVAEEALVKADLVQVEIIEAEILKTEVLVNNS
jgi:hypothetical protein